MQKQNKIDIGQPKNDNMGSSFEVMLNILYNTNILVKGDTITLNLQNLSFVYPFLILPLTVLIRRWQNEGINVSFQMPIGKCGEYLNIIRFPNGFNPIYEHYWIKGLQYFKDCTYLPICCIPSGTENPDIRDNLLTTFCEILKNQLDLNIQLQSAVSYLISEAIDNIVEHANIENGWIMVQNYPKKKFLDVCIVDSGQGILGSYQNANFDNITSHMQALQEAINGRSTKKGEQSRGYGIITSRRMLVKGLSGKYFLYSGNAFYIWTNEHEQINYLNEKISWKGTILALRIPKTIPERFNYVNFLE